MKTKIHFLEVACCVAAAVTGLTSSCPAQGNNNPFIIGFDGPPVQASGTAALTQNYTESGMTFAPIGPLVPGNYFARVGNNPTSFRPDNGTAYLQAALGNSLSFSTFNGTLFDLLTVDLAEYSTVVPNAVTVHFIGYYAGGGTITTDFTTDGIIDGTGPGVDFQSFQFSSSWSGLTRVEIPTSGWSLDNLVVHAPGVPEPTTAALLLLGAGVLWRWRSRSREATVLAG